MGTLLITEGNVTGLAGYKPVGSGSLRRPALPGLLVSRFCCLVSTAGSARLGWDAISSPPSDVARTRVLRCRIPVSERRCLDGAHGSTGLAQNGQLMSHVECYFRS